jgi:RHS repeat-associated protein
LSIRLGPTPTVNGSGVPSCTDSGSDPLRLTYTYGSPGADNGNVTAAGILARPSSVNVSQSFGYDACNRLKTATEGTAWQQTYVYDQFGNRAVLGGSGWQYYIPGGDWTPQVTADDAGQVAAQYTGNRWTSANVQYDNGLSGRVGNITALASNTFGYDAENRMVTSTTGGVTTTYVYDGDGRRVQKTTGGATTTYVYDAAGQLAAEYSAGLGAEPCTTCYLTADTLGSTRAVTDGSGTVKALHDYLPFGEEIAAGTPAARSTTYYPGDSFAINDGVTEKFTGKERDQETGLDFFLTRYMSSAQGRFTSPDEPLVDQLAENPQSWNLYQYVRNNPLRFTDPVGQGPCVNGINPETGNICVDVTAPKPKDPEKPQPAPGLSPMDEMLYGVVFGHHGMSNWRKIPDSDAYRFFRKWCTGPLKDKAANYYDALHRAYNKAVGDLVNEFLKNAGKESLKDLSKEEIKQLARAIMNSKAPGIQNFLTRLGSGANTVLNGLIDTLDVSVVVTVGLEQQSNLVKCGQIDCGGHQVY